MKASYISNASQGPNPCERGYNQREILIADDTTHAKRMTWKQTESKLHSMRWMQHPHIVSFEVISFSTWDLRSGIQPWRERIMSQISLALLIQTYATLFFIPPTPIHRKSKPSSCSLGGENINFVQAFKVGIIARIMSVECTDGSAVAAVGRSQKFNFNSFSQLTSGSSPNSWMISFLIFFTFAAPQSTQAPCQASCEERERKRKRKRNLWGIGKAVHQQALAQYSCSVVSGGASEIVDKQGKGKKNRQTGQSAATTTLMFTTWCCTQCLVALLGLVVQPARHPWQLSGLDLHSRAAPIQPQLWMPWTTREFRQRWPREACSGHFALSQLNFACTEWGIFCMSTFLCCCSLTQFYKSHLQGGFICQHPGHALEFNLVNILTAISYLWLGHIQL